MKVIINNPTTQKTKYGSYTPQYFIEGIRYDLYKGSEGEVIESVLVLNTQDTSEVQTKREYNSMLNCHCCFANYAHSINLCNERNKNA